MRGARPDGSHDELIPEEIERTIERLRERIEERFPGCGLGRVGARLAELGRQAEERARWIGRPIVWLRCVTWLFAAMVVLGVVATLVSVPLRVQSGDAGSLVQTVEAGTNELLAIGAGLLFLLTVETRLKRRRALQAIHELRSIAHIIDMHQLTKDPERVGALGPGTESSPTVAMSRFELGRYLDYCSEMLSLVGKIAAVYVQRFDDHVALASAGELETLVTGLSRKIWQKIMIVRSLEDGGGVGEPGSVRDGGGVGEPGSVRDGGGVGEPGSVGGG